MEINWDDAFDKAKKAPKQRVTGADLAKMLATQMSEDTAAQLSVQIMVAYLTTAPILNALKETNPDFAEKYSDCLLEVLENVKNYRWFDKADNMRAGLVKEVDKIYESGVVSKKSKDKLLERLDKLGRDKEESRVKLGEKVDEIREKKSFSLEDLNALTELIYDSIGFTGVTEAITEVSTDTLGKTLNPIKSVPESMKDFPDFEPRPIKEGVKLRSEVLRLGAEYEDGTEANVPDMFPATTTINEKIDINDGDLENFIDQWSKEM